MKIYIFLFLFIISFFKVNTQTLDDTQYNCIANLESNFNIFGGITIYEGSDGKKLYCESGQGIIVCDSNSVTSIVATFGFSTTILIGYDSISCLPYLTSIQINGFYINESLISTQHQSLNSIYIINPKLISFNKQSAANLNILQITFSSSNGFTIPITYYFTVKNILISGGNILYSRGDKSINGNLTSLFITSNAVPDLSGITIGQMIFTLGSNVDETTFSNFSSWSLISSISIRPQTSSYYEFPLQLLNSKNLKQLFISYQIKSISQLIDLSNLSSINTFSLQNIGSQFNYNGEIPFSKYPSQSFNLDLQYGNFTTLPQLNTFSSKGDVSIKNNIFLNNQSLPSYSKFSSDSLNIISNTLKGTVDSTWCGAEIYKINLSNNKLSGSLPDCIRCYLNDSTVYNSFTNNLFDNFIIPSSPCDTIQTNFEFINSSYVRLTGTYLPFSSSGILSKPAFDWTMVSPGSEFIALYNNPNHYQKIDITLTAPYKTWSFSLNSSIAPVIQSAIVSSGQLTINGQYFSQNMSNINVWLNNTVCSITESSFYQIKCTFSVVNGNTKALLRVKVNDVESSVYVDFNDGTYSTTCIGCSDITRGICYLGNGVCQCSAGFSGENCGAKIINCLNNCSNHGTCEYSTGQCSCYFPYTFDDCSGQICQPDINCGGTDNGACNYTIGVCECKEKWQGGACNLAAIYANTFSLNISETGGLVEITGWFGSTQGDLIIMIGDLGCNIQSFSSNLITCNIGPGTGKKYANMTSNGVQWKSLDYAFQYAPVTQTNVCVPSCTNGMCVNSGCVCFEGFNGIDCSSPIKNNTPQTGTEVDNNGTSYIYNGNTKYQIYLVSVIEIDITGKVVSTYPLEKNWKVIEYTESIGRTVFSQYLNNNATQLNFTIDEVSGKDYPNGKQYTFAGVNFVVQPNSIKVQFSMENYIFSNSLNSLQLLMKSSVSNINNDEKDECNNDNASTDTNESDNTLNYLSISKDNKQLYGRFIDKCVSDNRVTLISTSIYSQTNDTIIVSINLPHVKNVLIDPDFSVLVQPSFVDSCSDDNKKNWIVPVAVVVPAVAIVAIVIVTIIVLKKNRMSIKLKLNKLERSMSMKSFKSRN